MSSYYEILQTLFHTLELYGYVFEETHLNGNKIKSVFQKIILYDGDDEDETTICINVEFDKSLLSKIILNEEQVKIMIYNLREPNLLPNVNVPRRVLEERDEEAEDYDHRNPTEELKVLFQILRLHDYKYNKTIHLPSTFDKLTVIYPSNVQTVFKSKKLENITVEIEFNTGSMNIDLENAQTFVENLIYEPAAKGKRRRNQKPKKTRKHRKIKGRKTKKTQRR